MTARSNDMATYLDELEARLREADTCYRVIAGHAPDWDYWLGSDGRYKYVSPACEAICGHPPGAFLTDPGLFCQLLHPDDRALWDAHLATGTSTTQGVHDNLVLRVIDRTGALQWIEHQCAPVADSDGTYLGRRGVNRNITARIHAQDETRHVSRLLKTLSEVNQAITRVSNESDMVEAVCRIAVDTGGLKACMVALGGELSDALMVYGYVGPGEQIPDAWQPTLDGAGLMLPGGERQAMGVPLDRGVAGTHPDSIARHAWMNDHEIGTLLHLPLRHAPHASRKFGASGESAPIGVMSFFAASSEFLRADVHALLDELASDLAYALDSFKHRRLEFETRWRLAQREAYLNALLRNVPIGIGVCVARVFTEVNSRICEMLGYGAEELLGESVRVMYPDDAEYERVGREQYAEMAATGKGRIDTRWQRKDGRIIHVHLINSPLDPGDPSKGVVFTAEAIEG